MNGIRVILLGCCLLATACERAVTTAHDGIAETTGAGRPFLVAHRGASASAPENTLAAFHLAFEHGADAIEGDFWLTADGRIVAHHDRTLERTAGLDREVESMTLAELREQDVGQQGDWSDAGLAGERIPTLDEVLALLPEGRGIFIELKSDARIVPALAALLEESGLQRSRYTIISFDADTLRAVRERLPGVRTLWIVHFDREHGDDPWTPAIEEVVATARRIGVDGVDLNANLDVLTDDAIARLRGAGLEVHVWTVNDPADARRVIDLGVDSITTDRPRGLRDELQ